MKESWYHSKYLKVIKKIIRKKKVQIGRLHESEVVVKVQENPHLAMPFLLSQKVPFVFCPIGIIVCVPTHCPVRSKAKESETVTASKSTAVFMLSSKNSIKSDPRRCRHLELSSRIIMKLQVFSVNNDQMIEILKKCLEIFCES